MREDVADFLRLLDSLPDGPVLEARGLFDSGRDVVVTRAPGRLDLMGGIADYSGSLVLQWPIREATFAALQLAPDRLVRIVSLGDGDGAGAAAWEMPLDELEALAGDQDAARRHFARAPADHWAAYAAGAILVLMRARGVRLPGGVRMLISSRVPEGKGVSSSAALEVAAMRALADTLGVALDGRETALLCQQVENRVVGAPCGVMDQMASSCGREGELLALLCRPAELQGTVALPEGLAVWGIDSGIRHSVSGADYGSVRTAAFMGRRILTGLEPAAADTDLAAITPSIFEQHYAAHLPRQITGAEFTERHGTVADALSVVVPDRVYGVRAATAHPIYENFRVHTFRELLGGDRGGGTHTLLGELMYQSHTSYSACGLGSAGTDRLVSLVRALGTGAGLYGAKITGGGSGGTVAVLGRRGADEAVRAVAAQYQAESGLRPMVFTGSSPGAEAFGSLTVRCRGGRWAPLD